MLIKFPTAKQTRLDELLERNTEGQIAPEEKVELEKLVEEAEKLIVENAKALADFAEGEGQHPPEDAVPVTVWVKGASVVES